MLHPATPIAWAYTSSGCCSQGHATSSSIQQGGGWGFCICIGGNGQLLVRSTRSRASGQVYGMTEFARRVASAVGVQLPGTRTEMRDGQLIEG